LLFDTAFTGWFAERVRAGEEPAARRFFDLERMIAYGAELATNPPGVY